MAEMYVGDDVSPDFYGWVFPKYDHVGVGTGTVVNRPAIKEYQVGFAEISLPRLVFWFCFWFRLWTYHFPCSRAVGFF